MQRNAHDTRLLAAVGVERIELIDHRAQILLASVTLADEQRDVVDLVAVGNCEHFSRLDLHRIGLVVVIPVAAILHASRRCPGKAETLRNELPTVMTDVLHATCSLCDACKSLTRLHVTAIARQDAPVGAARVILNPGTSEGPTMKT